MAEARQANRRRLDGKAKRHRRLLSLLDTRAESSQLPTEALEKCIPVRNTPDSRRSDNDRRCTENRFHPTLSTAAIDRSRMPIGMLEVDQAVFLRERLQLAFGLLGLK